MDKLSRRQFLRTAGLGAAGAALGNCALNRPVWGDTYTSGSTLPISPDGPNLLQPEWGVLLTTYGPRLPTVPWAAIRNGQSLVWRISVPADGYYRVAVNWREPLTDWGMRAQIMLGQRVLGVLYDSTQPGVVRIPAGEYDLSVFNPYWPLVNVLSLTLTPTAQQYKQPLGTFCLIQDWHTSMAEPVPPATTVPGHYGKWLAPAEAWPRDQQAVDSIIALQPDFFVTNGDAVHWGYPDSIDKFAALMAQLPFPWYATTGHHETKIMAQDRAYLKTSWGSAMPGDDCWFYFDFAGVRLIFLDSSYFQGRDGRMYVLPPPDWPGQVGCLPEERTWLKGVLQDNRTTSRLPVIVITHHTVPTYRPLPPPLWNLGKYRTGPPGDQYAMRSLLESDLYVRLVLSGHAHFQMVQKIANVYYVQGAAMCEGPMTYLRVLVFADHFEVETYQPVTLDYLVMSDRPPQSRWLIGYPGDINTNVPIPLPS